MIAAKKKTISFFDNLSLTDGIGIGYFEAWEKFLDKAFLDKTWRLKTTNGLAVEMVKGHAKWRLT